VGSKGVVEQFLIQAKAVGLVVVWTAVVAFVAFYVVKLVVGLRVAEDHEREGLDITSHGERAYTG
jgi:Amt family ammonium transporter